MRLHSLKLRNFRCYKDETVIKFDDITAIVGRNDAGKSSLLDALNIFFEEGKLDKDDAAFDGHREDVEITCEFEDFPARAIVDDTALTTFEDEMLLNRDGRLEIVKKYNGTLSIPKASIFARAMHPTTEGYSDLLQLKRSELRARADALGVDLSNVNKIKNAPIRQAIWLNADDLRINETLIPLDTEDARRIWERLTLQLPMFALFKSDRVSTDQDPEAQDPLKSAIRDALESKREDLAAIQAHVLSETQKVANKTVEKIREMDPTLASTLSPIITPKKWESLFQTSITGDEGIPLNKRGSGTRRLILLNFFRATAESQASGQESGSVIYGIEEPETSQHPRNQRMLLSALREISSVPGRQVILTTHTPMLARTLPDKSLRFVNRLANDDREILLGSEENNRTIADSLGVLADHSVNLFIGVEGKHDINFLKGMSRLLISAGEAVPDLEALEIDGRIIFFPLGGNNLVLWVSRLEHLNRPEFHIYDRDAPLPDPPKYQDEIDEINNTRINCTALSTNKREMENYVHPDAIARAYQKHGISVSFSGPFADFDDVPMLVAQAVYRASGSGKVWNNLRDKKKAAKISNAKSILNEQVVAEMDRAELRQTDPGDEVKGWLETIGDMMDAD